MRSVLFVCTANVCRSPMATALFQNRLMHLADRQTWRIESAGTWARNGLPVPRHVETVMGEWGLTLQQHRSRMIQPQLVTTFDLILVMEKGHREALRIEFPQRAHRVVLLSELAGYRYDIADPINGSLDDVRATAHELAALLARGFDRIVATVAPATTAG